MSKPETLQTKIFLDSGDPQETQDVINLLGFLDGQTTNPSLVAGNPAFSACQVSEGGCINEDLWHAYRTIVSEISPLVPDSVSVEVYADAETTAEEMIVKGREISTWIPNAHVKLPITTEGLAAAETLSQEGIRLNMTLCFTQAQAAAVFAATRGAKPGDVYLSPFVGRLDDQGKDGMSFIKNVITLFEETDGHVQTLVASVRTLDHFLYSLALGAPIITAPGSILKTWVAAGMEVPDASFEYLTNNLEVIPFETHDVEADWRSFDISHPLTDSGLVRFAADWNSVLE